MIKPSKQEWEQYLTNYCASELQGAEFIEELNEFAPGPKEKEWLKIWSAEEHNHHKIWAKVLKHKKLPQMSMQGALPSLYHVAQRFVKQKNWVGAMVAASVIEHTSNATAQYLYPYADTDVKAVFRKITGDDLGHLNFDVAQIGIAAKTKKGRKAIYDAHKEFLKVGLQWPSRDDILDSELVIMNAAYELHRLALKRVGVWLPSFTFSHGMMFAFKKQLARLVL